MIFWKTIENTKSPDDFRTYLKAYPNGIYVPLAQARIRAALDQFLIEPLSPGEAPGMPATMKYIENGLTLMEKVKWPNGGAWEWSSASADGRTCTLSFHLLETSGVVTGESSHTLLFRDVNDTQTPVKDTALELFVLDVYTTPKAKSHQRYLAKDGSVTENDSTYFPDAALYFKDEQAAIRMRKAIKRAVELCRAGSPRNGSGR
jgi:hypothetical protein